MVAVAMSGTMGARGCCSWLIVARRPRPGLRGQRRYAGSQWRSAFAPYPVQIARQVPVNKVRSEATCRGHRSFRLLDFAQSDIVHGEVNVQRGQAGASPIPSRAYATQLAYCLAQSSPWRVLVEVGPHGIARTDPQGLMQILDRALRVARMFSTNATADQRLHVVPIEVVGPSRAFQRLPHAGPIRRRRAAPP